MHNLVFFPLNLIEIEGKRGTENSPSNKTFINAGKSRLIINFMDLFIHYFSQCSHLLVESVKYRHMNKTRMNLASLFRSYT